MNKDGRGWRRLTRITNDELEKLGLNVSRSQNSEAAPLMNVNQNFSRSSFTVGLNVALFLSIFDMKTQTL